MNMYSERKRETYLHEEREETTKEHFTLKSREKGKYEFDRRTTVQNNRAFYCTIFSKNTNMKRYLEID